MTDARYRWQQIADDIRGRIISGEFDRALPGITELCGQYQTAVGTIVRAEGHLAGEGWIRIDGGKSPRINTAAVPALTDRRQIVDALIAARDACSAAIIALQSDTTIGRVA